MLEKISYNKEDMALVEYKLKSNGFSSRSWSDSDISELKAKIKKHYIVKQKYTCPFCRCEIKSAHGRNWDIEHIIPRSEAPEFMFEPMNLCVSCLDCNIAKSSAKVTSSKAKKNYPVDSSLYYIVHPHIDVYQNEILVIREGFYYIAISLKGEKTIEFCRLNRFYLFSDPDDRDIYDERIHLLSNALIESDDENNKMEILRELAFLSTKGAQNLNKKHFD